MALSLLETFSQEEFLLFFKPQELVDLSVDLADLKLHSKNH